MKRDTNKSMDQEDIYQCQGQPDRPCGSLWSETALAIRPITGQPYCRTCQSETLKLCDEAMAVEHSKT